MTPFLFTKSDDVIVSKATKKAVIPPMNAKYFLLHVGLVLTLWQSEKSFGMLNNIKINFEKTISSPEYRKLRKQFI